MERWLLQKQQKTVEKETIYVKIPQGIDNGEIIIVSDKGNVVSDTCKGDIKLFIKIDNNTQFKRRGLDLILDKKITLKEALCGFSFEIKYLTGKSYAITNNAGHIIHPGYNKVIPNMGITRSGQTGNLVIIFEVEFPDKLSSETVAEFSKIAF